MPTYEYECTNCRKAWELFQSIKAEPERTCPKCGKRSAVRKFGIGAGILTGGRGGDAEPGTVAPKAEATKTATDAAAGTKAGTAPAPEAKALPAAPAPAPAKEGSVNATHPAREGRGAGNLRDAIARQRKQAGKAAKPARGRKGK